MAYQQNLDACFADVVGPAGIARDAFDGLLARSATGLARLRAQYRDGSLPLLRLAERHDDLDAAKPLLDHLLNNTSDLVVFGTGGSSLGAQAIAQAAGAIGPLSKPAEGRPRLHFLDNLDPLGLDAALDALDLRTTRFLVISKSGATAETLAQMFAAMGRIQAAGGGKYMRFHFGAIAEPGDNPLRAIAAEQNFPVADHDPGIGGRFSVLSNVGLVPAIAAGLDAAAIRAGAAAVLQPVLDGAAPGAVPAAAGAALAVAAAQHGLGAQVMVAYADRLERFGKWWRQLWAESLGKQGKGTLPVDALGPVDQHSQLQLWLDGPGGVLFTALLPAVAGTGATIPAELAAAPALSYLAGRTVGDLVDAEQHATVETLGRAGRPVRTFVLPALDGAALGALFMHFMLETLLAADLLGVDALDQPAVEQGKVLARQRLAAR